MICQIKTFETGKIMFSNDCGSMRECLAAAAKASISLEGANLASASFSPVDLSGMNLAGAVLTNSNFTICVLRGVNLKRANLSMANFYATDLSGSDLSEAHLFGTNMYDTNLDGVNFSGTRMQGVLGLGRYALNPLKILLDQPGKIRAYKLLRKDGSPLSDDRESRIGVGTLEWCQRSFGKGIRFLAVEFRAEDIVEISDKTNGEFWVRKFNVLGEYSE